VSRRRIDGAAQPIEAGRDHHGPVVVDRHACVSGDARQPADALAAHGERGRRVGVGGADC
jgi:hypothetical protein